MASQIPGKAVRGAVYGIKVDRAASNLAQTGNLNLFTITGGRVLITNFVGEVTTSIQAQTNALRIEAVAASGGTTMQLCGDAASSGVAAGNLLGFPGPPAAAAAAAGVFGTAVPQPNETVVKPGTVRMVTSASNTGQMSFSLTYIPLDDGATVVAA